MKTDQVLREEALISVFGKILENKDLDRQKEFEKLVKECIFYGTREIYEKAEAGNLLQEYYKKLVRYFRQREKYNADPDPTQHLFQPAITVK